MIDKRYNLRKLSTRTIKSWTPILIALLLVPTLAGIANARDESVPLLSPKGESLQEVVPLTDPALIQFSDAEASVSADELIDDNCSRFYSSDNEIQYCKFQMHCLYWKESRNGQSNDHGDGGKAGGPFQFWADTYRRARHSMIMQGHEKDTGSRYDLENAVETTVWMLSEGRGNEYGPILRGECK